MAPGRNKPKSNNSPFKRATRHAHELNLKARNMTRKLRFRNRGSLQAVFGIEKQIFGGRRKNPLIPHGLNKAAPERAFSVTGNAKGRADCLALDWAALPLHHTGKGLQGIRLLEKTNRGDYRG